MTETAAREVPFELVFHLLVLPALVNGVETHLVLDSGIGLTMVRSELAASFGLVRTGDTFTGRRMSGAELVLPLARVGAVELGGETFADAVVALWEPQLPSELDHVGGFVSLSLLAETPFTVDYERRRIVFETPDGLAARRAAGSPVPLRVERDGPSTEAYVELTIPGGRTISVELDLGSHDLFLHADLADETGAPLEGEGVQRVEGTDEIGKAFARTVTRLPGPIRLAAAPEIAQATPPVIFQPLIHDGLLGHAFLGRQPVTWDVLGATLIFGRT